MYNVYTKLRDERGVTDYRVAKATGVSASTLSEWKEKSKHGVNPKLVTLSKLADYFGVSVTVFFQ